MTMKVGFTAMDRPFVINRFLTVENGRFADDLGGEGFVSLSIARNAAEVLRGGESRLGIYLDPGEARDLARVLLSATDEVDA